MSKFVVKMKRSPHNIRFDELDRVLQNEGFVANQSDGSHVVYRRDDGTKLTVVRPHGGAKTVHVAAVRQVLKVLEL
jgi:predicted RNA binding protein YcfA (HicA-like mRNA interferase family)